MKNSKIIISGNFGVGKSSIFNRIINDSFNEKYFTNIGVKVANKNYNDRILTFWDVAGEVSQDKIPHTYFRDTDCILYVIDLNRPNSFINLNSDMEYLKSNFSNIPLIKIGNKIDLFSDDNLLHERVLETAPDFLCSAKTGQGIVEILKRLTL